MPYTNRQVAEAIERIVLKFGEDYVYPDSERVDGDCRYASADGSPSCLVGHVIHELSPEWFEELRRAEATSAPRIGSSSGSFAVPDIPGIAGTISRRATAALTVAQSLQDCGRAWGWALEGFCQELGPAFDELYAEVK